MEDNDKKMEDSDKKEPVEATVKQAAMEGPKEEAKPIVPQEVLDGLMPGETIEINGTAGKVDYRKIPAGAPVANPHAERTVPVNGIELLVRAARTIASSIQTGGLISVAEHLPDLVYALGVYDGAHGKEAV